MRQNKSKGVSIFGDPSAQLTLDLICMAEKVGLRPTLIPSVSRVYPEASYDQSQWEYTGKKTMRGLSKTAAHDALTRYAHCR